MEKIEGIMGKLFVAAATLGGISCLARADYNLPLFIFIYFMWAHDPVMGAHNLNRRRKSKS